MAQTRPFLDSGSVTVNTHIFKAAHEVVADWWSWQVGRIGAPSDVEEVIRAQHGVVFLSVTSGGQYTIHWDGHLLWAQAQQRQIKRKARERGRAGIDRNEEWRKGREIRGMKRKNKKEIPLNMSERCKMADWLYCFLVWFWASQIRGIFSWVQLSGERSNYLV